MEKTVFPLPEVSGLLANTIEARLHADKSSHPLYDRMIEVQTKYSGVKTAPVYLVVDPSTDKILGRQDGASSPETFRAWLQKAISASS